MARLALTRSISKSINKMYSKTFISVRTCIGYRIINWIQKTDPNNQYRPPTNHKNTKLIISLLVHAELFVKSFSPQATIGTLSFLRVLLPKLLSASIHNDPNTLYTIIEILEVCLHLLNDPSHTIINASLECICVILNQPNVSLKNLLNSKSLEHNDILHNRKSLKNKIFNRKLSASSIELSKTESTSQPKTPLSKRLNATTGTIINASGASNMQSGIGMASTPPLPPPRRTTATAVTNDATANDAAEQMKKSWRDNFNEHLDEGGNRNESIRLSAASENDDKCLLTCSDNDMESLKSMDFETNLDRATANESFVAKSNPAPRKSDSISLKSQKSTESIGSFFNSILSHPNTGTYYITKCI